MACIDYTRTVNFSKVKPGDRIKWALSQGVDPTAKLVLVVLTDHYNTEREDAFPSVRLIAERSGFCTKSVARALSRLEANGLIAATRKVGRVTVWHLFIGPRLVEQPQVEQPQVEQPEKGEQLEPEKVKPKRWWLHRQAKNLAHWRKVYRDGGDLDGIPFSIAETLFEEGREVLDNVVNNSPDPGHRVLGTLDTESN